MNTNNTPNGAEGPPATSSNVRGHAAADTAATSPSPSTVHAPSSTEANGNNSSAANSVIQDVKPAAVESTSASASDGKVGPDKGGSYVSGDISKTLATLPQPSRLEPPRPFNVTDYDEAEDAELKRNAKQAMATDASSDLSEMVASFPQPILPKPPRPFNVADYDEAGDAKLKNKAKQAAASSLHQTQPNPLEPPLPFNIAKFDEGEDAELKNKAKHVGASRSNESIIIPAEEDIADGSALDPAISRERPTRGDEGEPVDLESGGKVEPSQSKEEESEESSQDDVAPFNSELPVLEAYIVDEESRRDVVIATQLEPTLPWWKQRRFKLFLSIVFVVFATLAIALGVSMSSSSSGVEPTVVMVEKTSAPSKSLVPTSIPSVSLRPSVHPSLSPTTTPSPTFASFESLKLVAEDGAANDSFGRKVAVFGDTVVVGAPYDDDKGKDSGSAYIYYRDLQTKEWIFHQKLVADDGAADDWFGDSVAIYGRTIVVGAYLDDDKGDNSGSAYIYHQVPETKEWIFQQKLVPDDGAANAEFGSRVAIFGNTVVVGAKWDDTDKGDNRGSAYIYHQDSETKGWIFEQKLVPDDGAEGDLFGFSVAIYGRNIVVGAPQYNGDASGSAYIYYRDLQTKEWIFDQKLVPDDGAAGDNFCYSVGIYDGTIVVGAYLDDDKGDNSGSAYIYHQDLQTKEWIFQQKLVSDDGAIGEYFGMSVGIYDGTIVVGAHYDDTDKGFDSGSSYIYYRDTVTKEWILHQKLVPDDSATSDYFGVSVAIYNGTVVVGAFGDDGNGSAYVYSSSYTRAPSPVPSSSLAPSITLNPSAMPTQSSKPSTSSSPTGTCYWITVTVVYDEYPLDTLWEIVSIGSNGTEVVVKSYEELDQKATSHAEDVCLPEGEYDFVIFDRFSDGLCCTSGDGHYNVTSLDGEIIAQGGEFGAEDRTRFSILLTPVQPSPT